jgi:hypothetical protein
MLNPSSQQSQSICPHLIVFVQVFKRGDNWTNDTSPKWQMNYLIFHQPEQALPLAHGLAKWHLAKCP